MKTIAPLSVLAAGLLSAASLSGQNFNPTIEVTNTYRMKAAQASKPQEKMNVPDSLLRFDLDFDYEVFDRPYEGAYSFKPYELDARPGKDAWRGRKLYIKAGAGYSLRPDAQIVWSPELDGSFQMSVHASHKSYFGGYNSIVPLPRNEDGVSELARDGKKSYKGYDSYTSAGFDGRFSWDKAVLSFEAGYRRLDVKDTLLTQAWQSADFGLRVRSVNASDRYFLYDVALSGSFGYGNLDYVLPFTTEVNQWHKDPVEIPSGKSSLNETGFTLRGDFGPVFNSRHRVLVGFESSNYKYTDFFNSSAGLLRLNPRYIFEKNRWHLNLGVSLEGRIGGQVDSLRKSGYPEQHPGTGWSVHPDLSVNFRLAPEVCLYASLTGGNEVNAYSSLLGRNHHFNPAYSLELRKPLMDFSTELFRFRLGAKGQAASRLQFDLSGGLANLGGAPLDCIYYSPHDPLSSKPWDGKSYYGLCTGIDYYDFSLAYADLALAWKSKNLTVDASFHYRFCVFPDYDMHEGTVFAYPFRPSKFSGDLRAVYSIGPRIKAGINVEAASNRDTEQFAGVCRIPGYVDLGVVASWQVSRKFGLWVESGNLLFQNIQRVPLISEKGAWGTVGLTLSL